MKLGKGKKKTGFNYQLLLKVGFGLILFLLFVLALITSFTGLRKIGNFRLFSVQSASMSPALRAGSLIVVQEKDNYQREDIITFVKNLDPDKKVNKAVTHRIADQIREEGEVYYVTKGDANENPDKDLLKKSDILGRVIFSIPLLGYLVTYTQTLTGLIVLIVIPGTIIIYSELLGLKKEMLSLWDKRKTKKKKKKRKGKIQIKKNSKAAVLVCLFWVLRSVSVASFSYYSDSGEIQSLGFSLADWVRPESEITSEDDLVNQSSFKIDYLATDDDLDYVELWFSYNLGSWQFFGTDVPSSPGDFDFASPLGDGLYQFITVAVDGSYNVEDKNGNGVDDNLELSVVAVFLGVDLYEVQVDTQSPYTNLSLGEFGDDDWGENRFALNELALNGNFEDTLDPQKEWVWEGDGDHRVVNDLDLAFEAEVLAGDNSALIGWFDTDPVGTGEDYLYQVITLPHTPSTLSFWYRVISEDIVDYDFFSAKIIDDADLSSEEVIVRTGSDEVGIGSWSGDSFWQEITYSLDNWLGQTVRLWFGVNNEDELGFPLKTYALIDDVRVNNSTNWLTTEKEIETRANDSGSGIDTSYCQINGGGWGICPDLFTPADEGVGDGEVMNIDYYSVDLAGNIEATQSLQLVTDDSKSYFEIVLNQISPQPSGSDLGVGGSPLDGEWVELWNNSEFDIDLDSWVLKESGGGYLPILATNGDNNDDLGDGGETVVPAGGWLRVYRNGDSDFSLNDDSDKVELWTDYEISGGQMVDSFSYKDVLVDDKTWKRSPDGTGAWADPEPPETELSFIFLGGGRVKLMVNYLPAGFENLNYELTYLSSGVEKGIFGQVAGVEGSYFEKELFLGTCSGSSCLSDVIDEGKVLIRIEFLVGGKMKLIEKEVVF